MAILTEAQSCPTIYLSSQIRNKEIEYPPTDVVHETNK